MHFFINDMIPEIFPKMKQISLIEVCKKPLNAKLRRHFAKCFSEPEMKTVHTATKKHHRAKTVNIRDVVFPAKPDGLL